MKILNIKSLAIASILMVGMTSCEDFLNRPTEDSYTIDGFYKNDAQCFQAVNPIYNSPWYDFQRGFIKIGDVLAGNMYWPNSPYETFVLKSSDVDLKNCSFSLWAVNAYCNSVIENIELKATSNVSQTTKNTVIGEAMTWKAMTYFYLVRCFGAVPIIHSNSATIAEGQSNSVYRNKIADVYTYIAKTLEKAVTLLPENNEPERIDRYSAYGLLAKVYLAKSGVGRAATKDRDADDLTSAAFYARKVIEESGRKLMPVYSDIFRLENNVSDESLLAWRWTVGSIWTCQNTLQSDLALKGFDEFGDTWGQDVGLTIDLQNLFGEDARNIDSRVNNDGRRKATMMMMTDHYDYFWVDRGGFTYDWNMATTIASNGAEYTLAYNSNTGSNLVKNIVGNNNDHVIGCGASMQYMQTSLATHILRLADVYLVYAEAVLGNTSSTTDASALNAFNAVRGRSVKNYTPKTSITFDDIFNERRLELATEGDNWYDLVRLSYYKTDEAKARLVAQERGIWNNISNYYQGKEVLENVTLSSWKIEQSAIIFEIPFPDTDLSSNPNLSKDPVAFDFSTIDY